MAYERVAKAILNAPWRNEEGGVEEEEGNGPERSERIKPLFATFSVFDFVKNRAQPFVMIYECFTVMSLLQSAMNLHVHPIYFPSRDGWEGVVYPQCKAKLLCAGGCVGSL